MKKVRILALVSALATAALLYFFLSSQSRPAEVVTVGLLVASSDIPADTLITAGLLETAELPPEAVISGALADPSLIVGQYAKADIYAGEQLTAGKFVTAGDSGSRTLAYAIAPGMRAVTISVDATAGVGNMVVPGNRVDVLAAFLTTVTETTPDGSAVSEKVSYTTMILENVTVLAVDDHLSAAAAAADTGGYTTLTLQVTPEEAMELSEAEFEGELRVLLRSPVDTEETNRSSVTLDDIMIR